MTTTDAPVATVAAPALLNRFRDAALAPDAPLDATIAYLRELSNADEKTLAGLPVADPATRSHMARCELQLALSTVVHFLTTGVTPDVRAAPPSGLAEVLADVSRKCVNPACDERWLPWEATACSPECEALAETCI